MNRFQLNLTYPSISSRYTFFGNKARFGDQPGNTLVCRVCDPQGLQPESTTGRISTTFNPTNILPVAQERTSQWTHRVTNSLINLGKYGSACWARTSDPLINSGSALTIDPRILRATARTPTRSVRSGLASHLICTVERHPLPTDIRPVQCGIIRRQTNHFFKSSHSLPDADTGLELLRASAQKPGES